MTGHCEHPNACLHLRRSGGHILDTQSVVVLEPCQLPLCRDCAGWLDEQQRAAEKLIRELQ